MIDEKQRGVFYMSERQVAQYHEWLKTLPKEPRSAIGGGTTFSFSPTSLGTVIKVTAWNGDEIDLSDYDMW